MKLVVASCSRAPFAWANEAVRDYLGRLAHYGPTDEWILKPSVFHGDVEAVQRDEGRRLLGRLKPGDHLVVLDERGTLLDTQGWAGILERCARQGCRRIIFALGGPYGHAAAVRERAGTCVSLTPLVLNHQVARVVVFEQLYRVQALLRGEPYHHV